MKTNTTNKTMIKEQTKEQAKEAVIANLYGYIAAVIDYIRRCQVDYECKTAAIDQCEAIEGICNAVDDIKFHARHLKTMLEDKLEDEF